MSNTNTKVLLVGGIGNAVAKLLIDELNNEVNVLEEIAVVHTLHMHPPDMPACFKVHKSPSWSEMNKGKLSKRDRRK